MNLTLKLLCKYVDGLARNWLHIRIYIIQYKYWTVTSSAIKLHSLRRIFIKNYKQMDFLKYNLFFVIITRFLDN